MCFFPSMQSMSLSTGTQNSIPKRSFCLADKQSGGPLGITARPGGDLFPNEERRSVSLPKVIAAATTFCKHFSIFLLCCSWGIITAHWQRGEVTPGLTNL